MLIDQILETPILVLEIAVVGDSTPGVLDRTGHDPSRVLNRLEHRPEGSTHAVKLVKGKAEMSINYALEPWELEAGFVLACQCYPLSEELVLDYDQT